MRAVMDCKEVSERNMAEQYLLGQLSEARQQAFEEHYFDCPQCLAELQTLRAAQEELERTAPSIRREHPVRRSEWMPRWAWLAATALLIITAGALLTLRTPSFHADRNSVKSIPAPPASSLASLAELARFEPPIYKPVTLRGSSTAASRSFGAAMELYRGGRYEDAIPGLLKATELDPRNAGSRFFLGICHLLTKRTDLAIDSLRQVVMLGDTPYLEEAHFYLAKAYLLKSDVAAARQHLGETVQLQGDLENDAKHLLDQLAAYPHARE